MNAGHRQVTRRHFARLAIATATVVAAKRGSNVLAQELTTPVVSGDCSTEPGVQALIDFRLGRAGVSLAQLQPPLDWKLYSHPSLPLTLFIPPDWQPQAGWATRFTDSGMPIWETTPPSTPQLSGFRLTRSDGLAAFEYVVGGIQAQPLTVPQAASVALQGFLGGSPRMTTICTTEDPNPLAPSWFLAAHLDDYVVLSGGTALPLPDIYLPFTTMTYQNMIAPRDDLERVMREVYFRIFVQFMGGGSSPTPTPTPAI